MQHKVLAVSRSGVGRLTLRDSVFFMMGVSHED